MNKIIKQNFSKQLINIIETKQENFFFFPLKIGNIIKVSYKFLEAGKERVQVYKGIIIAIKNKGFSKTFTLRRRVQGIGIEQIFPYYSPKISSISKDSAPIFRRSKLFYLRFLLRGFLITIAIKKHYKGLLKLEGNLFTSSSPVRH